jgi:hypothetical protein
MQILVALAHKGHPDAEHGEASRGLNRILRYCGRLTSRNLETAIFSAAAGTIMYVGVRLEGCRWSFVQEDDETAVVSVGYPRQWQRVLGTAPVVSRDSSPLPQLCRMLQQDPTKVLSELVPPFLLAWIDKTNGKLWVANDGLGLAQAFTMDRNGRQAWSNKVFALPLASGEQLHPSVEDWQIKLSTGWFLGDRSGFRDIRFMRPGHVTQVSRRCTTTRTYDVMSRWLGSTDGDAGALITKCNDALKSSVADCLSYWDVAQVSLSGGIDSRAVTAAALATGNRIATRTSDREGGYESAVAQSLAQSEGLVWSRDLVELPSAEQFDASLDVVARWQFGDGHIHTAISSPEGALRIPEALMLGGFYGELTRGRFYRFVVEPDGTSPDDDRIIERLSRRLVPDVPVANGRVRQLAIDIIRETGTEARRRGVTGLTLCDYIYLTVKCRRWLSALSSGKSCQLQMQPFLDPDVVSAAFSLQPRDKFHNAVPRRIIEMNVPHWVAIPFAAPRRVSSWKLAKIYDRFVWWRPLSGAKYDQQGYLAAVCGSFIETALASRGDLLGRVVDIGAAREVWRRAALHSPSAFKLKGFFMNVLGLGALERVLERDF